MTNTVLSVREQSNIRDEWLDERLSTIVPEIMRRAGIDCWVLTAREYNEDPVVKTMLPATWITARRRTILVFTEFGNERVAIARYGVGSAFPAGWSPEEVPDQWERLASYLDEKNPMRIGVNRSTVFALADGLSATEDAAFRVALPGHLLSRVIDTDELAIGWLETRSAAERRAYPDVCTRAHGILRRALSAEVIQPEHTTTADVEWWLRQEVEHIGYSSWFHPTVSVQRSATELDDGFAAHPGDDVVRHGDLVHIDFGIVYLGLHTDQQQHAYVLRPGETDAPDGLKRGMRAGNRLQDHVLTQFRTGVSGNAILAAARTAAKADGLDPTIYSHPIGLHGHGAGPTIGLWDQQAGVPGAGDYLVWPETAYSIELSVLVDVPEWDHQQVRIMLEEDAYFDGTSLEFLDGRQTDLWLI
jgi:hypothetical protein